VKFELKKGLSKATFRFFSVTTIAFAVLSLLYIENWLLRIFTQGSLCLMMLSKGIYTISNKKEKYRLGYLIIGAAAFIFFVMLFTIYVGCERYTSISKA
jgi:hypothetical protein